MAQGESSPKPVYVSDTTKASVIVCVLLATFSFLFGPIAFVFGPGPNSSSLTTINGNSFLFWSGSIVGVCGLGVAGYSILMRQRIEFYDDSVRTFSGRKKPKDIPYSSLEAHLNRIYLTDFIFLSVKGEEDRPLRVRDARIKRLSTSLFQWLTYKTKQLP